MPAIVPPPRPPPPSGGAGTAHAVGRGASASSSAPHTAFSIPSRVIAPRAVPLTAAKGTPGCIGVRRAISRTAASPSAALATHAKISSLTGLGICAVTAQAAETASICEIVETPLTSVPFSKAANMQCESGKDHAWSVTTAHDWTRFA
eukprot:7238685-Prymnesium_polylepis.1